MLLRAVRAFGRFWYQLIIGDDWRIAAIIVVVLGFGAWTAAAALFEGEILALVTGILVFVGFTALILFEYRRVLRS
jgi:type IV secretory pathway TrbL component